MFLAHLLKSGALHLHLIDPTDWKTKWKSFTKNSLKVFLKNEKKKKSLATWKSPGNGSWQNSKAWYYDYIEIMHICFKMDLCSSFLVSPGDGTCFSGITLY